VTQQRQPDPSYSSTRRSQSRGSTTSDGLSGLHQIKIPLRTHSTVKMMLQFKRKYSTQGSGAPCHVSFGFFSGFFGIRLAELQIGPQLEYAIRPKAQGLHSIWNVILQIAFSIWFVIKTTRVLLKTFERSTRGRLGTTREDFKTTQRSAGVPSSLWIIQAFIEDFRPVELGDAQGLLAKAIKTTRRYPARLQSTWGLVVRTSLGPLLMWVLGPTT
jgi:hypothetical protein